MDSQTIKAQIVKELEKYKSGENFKDYFLSMKELNDWLKEQKKS